MAEAFTPKDQIVLKEFRRRISDIISQLDEYDSHDRNLIRWLRARDMNVNKAENMIRLNLKTRKQYHVDDLQNSNFPELMLEKLPFTPCGHDRQGIVVCVIPFGIWDMKSLMEDRKKEEVTLYLAQIFERYFRHMKNTHTLHNFKTQVNLLVDYDQFSLQDYMSKQSWYNCKGKLFFTVPKVFEILWSMIKPFIPAGTLSKVRILGGGPGQWRQVLLENIDCWELPSQYGGSNTAHPFYANRFGDTWPTRASSFPPEAFLTANIPAGEQFVKNFELSIGNRISWNFKTEAYDIGFEFTLNGTRLFPYARADAHIWMQDGCVEVIEAGTYSLVFDNSYSKYRSKTLHYAVRVENVVLPDSINFF